MLTVSDPIEHSKTERRRLERIDEADGELRGISTDDGNGIRSDSEINGGVQQQAAKMRSVIGEVDVRAVMRCVNEQRGWRGVLGCVLDGTVVRPVGEG